MIHSISPQKNEHPLHTTSTGSMDKILAREKGRRGSKTALRKYSGPIGKLPKDTSGESISFWGVEVCFFGGNGGGWRMHLCETNL